MTCPVRLTSFVLLATWAALAQVPIARPQYVLMLSAPKTAPVVGTPVEVLVTLENISGVDLTILKSRATESGELTYDVTVINATGAPVALTPYGRALHGEQTNPPIIIRNSQHAITLKPHEKVIDKILLNKIYDLKPGNYIVDVKRAPSPESNFTISSQDLRLTVLPQ